MLKVAKFGGSSVAGAEQFRKVKAIVDADESRRIVVVSAAGKRSGDDHKLTDLLYLCHAHLTYGVSCDDIMNTVENRLVEIRDELGLSMDVGAELDRFRARLSRDTSVDEIVSRGEYFTSKLMAEFLGFAFVDAADCVFFNLDGQIDRERTDAAIRTALEENGKIVIPGFYGRLPTGRVRVMSRGGSDITGAVAAAAVDADVYENWTDVSGFLMADPRVVDSPAEISSITYKELRELSHMGATVLHEDAMFPVHRAGIPTNIRNTNKPYHPGTMISKNAPHEVSVPTITGIAGHKGYSVISVEKNMMNSEVGFGRKVLQVLEDRGVSFEHMPTGIDSMCVVVSSETLAPHRDEIIAEIEKLVEGSGSVSVSDNMSIIATVGRGMVHNCGTAARLFSSMSRARINVRMIDQGSSELSIIVGVNDSDFEATIHAIYHEFVE